MAGLFKWLFRGVVGLFAMVLVALVTVYWFAARSLPDYNAETEVAGISAPVEILRDTANIPHIFGASDADVAYGLGYAHAQDRLWQMMFVRRVAQGRLSELFGPRTVQTDTLLRRLDIYRAAQSSVAAQTPEARAILEAYSAGVNAWLEEVNAGAKGRGAPEFFLFPQSIAPWTPADSLAVLKVLALQLSSQAGDEVLRARLSLYLGDNARADEILSQDGTPALGALPEYAVLVPGMPRYASAYRAGDFSPVHKRAFAGASNAFAAAPERSAAGATLLASDPHLGFSAPAVWYLAHLELSSGGVIGGTTPGLPLILSGRSSDLGWGVTTAYVDDQDLFLEEVNPQNADQYRGLDGWVDFQARDTIITVKDGASVTVRLRWSENGPILDDSDYDSGTVRKPGHVMALAWTALDPADTTFSAALRLMQSRNVPQALAATQDYIAPAQNLTLADRNRIALATIGAVPKRDAAHATRGQFPSFGYIATNRWDGVMPHDTNPLIMDPPSGIVGNTNNKVVDRPFPGHIAFEYGDTQRIHRLVRLMQEREVHTRESFIGMQLDTVSATARRLLPLVGADLWFTGEAAPDGTPERQRQLALGLLAGWNGEMNEHLPEPLIYAAWMRALQTRLIADDLGPLADEFTHLEPDFLERVFRDTNGAAAWCDIVQSAPVESCGDIARLALDDALVWIAERHGRDLQSLRWGDAHQATHDHPTLGEVPVLKWFVNIRQSTSGGDNTLMRGRTSGTLPDPFLNVHGAGYRGVYDLADPESSVFIMSTGQSGHPLSRHYDDLGELWRRGEYVQMALDPALAQANPVGITRLIPR